MPLPLSREASSDAASEEMERAFTPDDDDDQEKTPLAPPYGSPTAQRTTTLPGQDGLAYDFERDYDIPPPGSPPAIYSSSQPAAGNSNGVVPSPSSAVRLEPEGPSPRPSFFRRTIGALLPQYYSRLPTSDAESRRVHGSGIENDGVFANVIAKQVRPTATTATDGNGETYVMPEDSQMDAPPVCFRCLIIYSTFINMHF